MQFFPCFFSPTEPSRTFVRLVNPQVFHLCSFLILTLFSTLLFTTRFKHIYKWCWDFIYKGFDFLLWQRFSLVKEISCDRYFLSWKRFFVADIFSCDRNFLLWKRFFVTEIFSCDRAEVTLEAMDWGARCRSGGIYSKWFLKEVESAFFHFWKETLSKVKNIFHFQSNCVIVHLCIWVEHIFLLESNFRLCIFFLYLMFKTPH